MKSNTKALALAALYATLIGPAALADTQSCKIHSYDRFNRTLLTRKLLDERNGLGPMACAKLACEKATSENNEGRLYEFTHGTEGDFWLSDSFVLSGRLDSRCLKHPAFSEGIAEDSFRRQWLDSGPRLYDFRIYEAEAIEVKSGFTQGSLHYYSYIKILENGVFQLWEAIYKGGIDRYAGYHDFIKFRLSKLSPKTELYLLRRFDPMRTEFPFGIVE